MEATTTMFILIITTGLSQWQGLVVVIAAPATLALLVEMASVRWSKIEQSLDAAKMGFLNVWNAILP